MISEAIAKALEEDGFTGDWNGAGDMAVDAVRRLLKTDPNGVAVELGFSLGGDLYRQGGYVQAYCIERT